MKNLLIITLMFSLVSCASKKDKVEDQNIDMQTVKTKIIKGKTTKAQVVEFFGSPELVNSGSDGLEQWVYSKHMDESSSQGGSMAAGVIGFFTSSIVGVGGGLSNDKHTSQSKTTSLYIYFNKKGVVQKYDYSRQKS